MLGGPHCGQVYAGICFLSALLGTGFLDRLSSVLLVLSTFLFGVVCRYSKRYWRAIPGQPRFTFWLCLTGAIVFALSSPKTCCYLPLLVRDQSQPAPTYSCSINTVPEL